jgi:hypothetical protein
MSNTHLKSISSIIQIVHGKISDESDVIWGGFDSPKKLRDEIERDLIELQTGNTAPLLKYKLWFAPTGPLGEIALSNNWANEYLKLAEEFDKLYKKISK